MSGSFEDFKDWSMTSEEQDAQLEKDRAIYAGHMEEMAKIYGTCEGLDADKQKYLRAWLQTFAGDFKTAMHFVSMANLAYACGNINFGNFWTARLNIYMDATIKTACDRLAYAIIRASEPDKATE